MKIIYSVILLIASANLFANTDSPADAEKGAKLFKQTCATCHGKTGEKSAMNQSKIINQLNADEIVLALQNRKTGTISISKAGNRIKSKLSEQDMKDIAEFLQKIE
ncbi:cytochrome c [Otariodibacter sp.]|uniref:c-type cytochrome n=1 Tax=Otariodibacter sp. TaxID=3030919 RepID=UPI002617E973|nr:cytochrome c [Otariodibacter sp.]